MYFSFKSKVFKNDYAWLLIKVKTADEAIKIKYFYERDVDVTKLVVPIKIKQRGKESVFCCNINISAVPAKIRRCWKRLLESAWGVYKE